MGKFKAERKKKGKSERYSIDYEKIFGKKRKKVYDLKELEEKTE